ncbi:hypothetical protein [Chryseobacterium indologenes]|uniref:Lipoprotein n=1 Tax=Chryseobacterium indologenes TaxID=253 RepID=A0A0N0IU89_CHRID|nr:hypothetical protein [Chryseobacterium indologenes]KPE49441.1 hypothetical protein AOB46_19935 [Chryseobacterium indologenes]
MKKIISVFLVIVSVSSCVPQNQDDDLEVKPSTYNGDELKLNNQKDSSDNFKMGNDTIKNETSKDDPPPKDGHQWKNQP